MGLIQGSARSGILAIKGLGLLGVFIGIAAHFFAWTDIDAGAGHHVFIKGYEGYGVVGIGILAIFAILLLLDSVYAILVLAVFVPYMLEQVFGVNLLRYMPLSSTHLLAPLYLMMPTGFVFALIGSMAPILSRLSPNEQA